MPENTSTLDLNAHVCQQLEDGKLMFGKVVEEADYAERGVFNFRKRIVWDIEGVENPNHPAVYNKLFREGQHVRRLSDGVIGLITRVNCLVSAGVELDGSKFIVTDIPLDRIQPISSIYPGIHVTCDGWIGTVQEVTQEWCLKFQGDKYPICRKSLPLLPAPEEEQGNIPIKYSSLMLPSRVGPSCTYPYFKPKRIGLVGQTVNFTFRQLRYANWKGSTSWKRRPLMLAYHFRAKPAEVLSVEENFVVVNWEYRYRENGAQAKPPAIFIKDKCKILKPRYIFPHEYFRSNSWVKIAWLETDSEKLKTEFAWNRELLESITGGMQTMLSPVNNEATPAKRPRLDSTIRYPHPGALLPVEVYSVRHELQVNWENRTTGAILAARVEPAPNLPHLPIPLDQKYVVVKPDIYRADADVKNYFGVNLGPNGENMMEIVWVEKQVQPETEVKEASRVIEMDAQVDESGTGSGSQQNDKIQIQNAGTNTQKDMKLVPQTKTRESVFDLDYHKEFGMFYVGDWVSKSEYCTNAAFDIGVIQSVGFDGQLVIRDENKTASIRLWPCEVRSVTPKSRKIQTPYLKTLKNISQILSAAGHDTLSTLATYEPCNDSAPPSHYFYSRRSFLELDERAQRLFRFQIFRDYMLLEKSTLPDRVWLHGYKDRYDLHSLLIIGPPGTPFQDIVFTFDIYLPNQYPRVLPFVRLNQMSNIPISQYVCQESNGFVDLSLLNPPMRKPLSPDFEPIYMHSLLSVVNAIHETMFQPHPMLSLDTILDPDDLNQMVKIAKQNQAVCIGCLDICIQTLSNLRDPWSEFIIGYYAEALPKIADTVSGWVKEGSNFPLLPATEGFTLSVNRRLDILRQLTDAVAASKGLN